MTTVLEGTWEEISERAPEFVGRRVRLLVFEALPSRRSVPKPDLTEAKRRAEEFLQWANGHRPNPEPLSDFAISRENMYREDP